MDTTSRETTQFDHPGTPDAARTGQVAETAAEVYERFFVPALFGQWAGQLCDLAGVRPGDDVLDVGCGTGVLAREAARRVAPAGTVTGLDLNDAMLAVARRRPGITWIQGDAAALPWDSVAFDRVLSQFMLMFVPDPAAVVQEMVRVTRPGGTVTVATWARVEESPGYAAMVELLDDVLGSAAADALRAPFVLGTSEQVLDVLATALTGAEVRRLDGLARFESLDQWLHTDIRGWTLADDVDDEQYAALREAAHTRLERFVDADGRVRFPAPALVATGRVS